MINKESFKAMVLVGRTVHYTKSFATEDEAIIAAAESLKGMIHGDLKSALKGNVSNPTWKKLRMDGLEVDVWKEKREEAIEL